MTRDTRLRHNPLLALPAAARLAELPLEARAALRDLVVEISIEAARHAETHWRKHKAPMAAYWKAVGVYAKHTARVIGPAPRRRPAGAESK